MFVVYIEYITNYIVTNIVICNLDTYSRVLTQDNPLGLNSNEILMWLKSPRMEGMTQKTLKGLKIRKTQEESN